MVLTKGLLLYVVWIKTVVALIAIQVTIYHVNGTVSYARHKGWPGRQTVRDNYDTVVVVEQRPHSLKWHFHDTAGQVVGKTIEGGWIIYPSFWKLTIYHVCDPILQLAYCPLSKNVAAPIVRSNLSTLFFCSRYFYFVRYPNRFSYIGS